MTKKKPSEISEVIYEAQEPIDRIHDLDEPDKQTEERYHPSMLSAIKQGATDGAIIGLVGGFAVLATSYLLIGS